MSTKVEHNLYCDIKELQAERLFKLCNLREKDKFTDINHKRLKDKHNCKTDIGTTM